MERRYGFTKHGRSEEFREEDVWEVITEDCETGFRSYGGEFRGEKPLLSISRRLPSAVRMIPGAQKHDEPHDNDEVEKPKAMQQQLSAPVNIPDWSKIYAKTHDNDDDDDNEDDVCRGDYEDHDDDNEGGRMTLPPHEWLARKLERSQISSFSVCEGAGRTLKGRDLSRVRNAILSKTGFI